MNLHAPVASFTALPLPARNAGLKVAFPLVINRAAEMRGVSPRRQEPERRKLSGLSASKDASQPRWSEPFPALGDKSETSSSAWRRLGSGRKQEQSLQQLNVLVPGNKVEQEVDGWFSRPGSRSVRSSFISQRRVVVIPKRVSGSRCVLTSDTLNELYRQRGIRGRRHQSGACDQ